MTLKAPPSHWPILQRVKEGKIVYLENTFGDLWERDLTKFNIIVVVPKRGLVGDSMKCAHCGGLLVWDYEHGEVVCSACGSVHDKLTSLEVSEYRTCVSDVKAVGAQRKTKTGRFKRILSREYKYRVELYEECLKLTKSKPWLEIDFDKVFETGRFVRTVTSRASRKALKNIEAHNYWKAVNEGLEYIHSVNPAYLARSERSKYALAYMVALKLKTGEYPSKESVVKVFNISDTSYRRLHLLAEKLLTTRLKAHKNRPESPTNSLSRL